jgi:hypothetical protein
MADITKIVGSVAIGGIAVSSLLGLSFQRSINNSDWTNPFHWGVHLGSETSGVVKRTGTVFFSETLEQNGLIPTTAIDVPRETCAPWDNACKDRQRMRELQQQQDELERLRRDVIKQRNSN